MVDDDEGIVLEVCNFEASRKGKVTKELRVEVIFITGGKREIL